MATGSRRKTMRDVEPDQDILGACKCTHQVLKRVKHKQGVKRVVTRQMEAVRTRVIFLDVVTAIPSVWVRLIRRRKVNVKDGKCKDTERRIKFAETVKDLGMVRVLLAGFA